MLWNNQTTNWRTRTPSSTVRNMYVKNATGQNTTPTTQTPAKVTPSWSGNYGVTKDPWRPTPADAMNFPFMQYLTGKSQLPGWTGPNLPMVSAQMWANLQPQERLTLQGLITGAGLTWDDYLARMQKLNPTWSMPATTQYTVR